MVEWVTLNSGKIVLIRTVQPDDLFLIDDMHKRLSTRSLYFRYLYQYRPTLSDARRICSTDDGKTGLVAVTSDHSTALGIVHFVAGRGPLTSIAELGIVVTDQVQGQGLGRALLDRAVQQAARRGIKAFHMDIHPANEMMMSLLYSTGYPLQEHLENGVREVRMMLYPYGSLAVHDGQSHWQPTAA